MANNYQLTICSKLKMINWDNVVGIKEIAQETGLKEQTLRQYRTDGKMPEPDAIKSGNPLWDINTISKWFRNRGK